MTLDEAKAWIRHDLTHGHPRTLDWIAKQHGAEKNRLGRYSKQAFKIYTIIGRALQTLKRDGDVAYLPKARGGPGWVLSRHKTKLELLHRERPF